MAGESPNLRYSGCVAAANYWNPGTALYGPFGSAQYLAVFISAARTVTLQTTGGGPMFGILQNSPALGQAADVAIGGISKAVAGAAISFSGSPVPLMVDTHGRLIAWTAGGGNTQVAEALEGCSAADSIITVRIYEPGFKVVT
jgi:hypothetical protein